MSTTMKCYKEYGKIEDNIDVLRVIVETIEGKPTATNVKLEFLQTQINNLIQYPRTKITPFFHSHNITHGKKNRATVHSFSFKTAMNVGYCGMQRRKSRLRHVIAALTQSEQ